MKRSSTSIPILAATVLAMAIAGGLQGQRLVLSGGPALRGFGRDIPDPTDRWSLDAGFLGAQLLFPAAGETMSWTLGVQGSIGGGSEGFVDCILILPCPEAGVRSYKEVVAQLRGGIALNAGPLIVSAGPGLVFVPDAVGRDLDGAVWAAVSLFPWRQGPLAPLGITGDATRLFRTNGGVNWILAPGISWRF